MNHDDVVAAFNELGYTATFAAVCKHLSQGQNQPTLDSLYLDYPSREVLAEHWLSEVIPPPNVATLREAFSGMVGALLGALESRRDFSRAWLASLATTGPLHLPEMQRLHANARQYFVTWLDAHAADISVPANVPLLQAKQDIADALCAVVLWLILHWESDRSAEYRHTTAVAQSAACLLDALLIARADYGGAGLLFHLHTLVDRQHQRFLRPLLDIFLAPERASRLIDPVSLIEIIRTLHPSPVQRP